MRNLYHKIAIFFWQNYLVSIGSYDSFKYLLIIVVVNKLDLFWTPVYPKGSYVITPASPSVVRPSSNISETVHQFSYFFLHEFKASYGYKSDRARFLKKIILEGMVVFLKFFVNIFASVLKFHICNKFHIMYHFTKTICLHGVHTVRIVRICQSFWKYCKISGQTSVFWEFSPKCQDNSV